MANKLYLVVICAVVGAVIAYRYPDLPPGPYCGAQGSQQCCVDRQDGCNHRILDTLCYCDEFCNRTSTHDDCCPDYEEVCLGIKPLPDPEPQGRGCEFGGKTYYPSDKVQKDCNTCECVQISKGVADWKCENDPCLMSSDVINGVNGQRGYDRSWRAANYSQFYGKKLKDALVYKLGTFPLSEETKRLGPIRYEGVNLPEFDARKAWPGFISPIVDQGWCGSDWAVAIASVSSDRFAIQSNGAEKLVLAPQSLLSCNLKMQQGCDGGHVDVAWTYAKKTGLVDEACFPYEAKVTRCRHRGTNLRMAGCTPAVPQRKSLYRVGPPGRLQYESDIMYDIKQSGPVHAIMLVRQDFFHYRDGVYRWSRYGNNDLQGYHSVRIVGWGEENGLKYWTVANSWGTWWGENGYFRIQRGANESEIESFVITVLAEVTNSYKRK